MKWFVTDQRPHFILAMMADLAKQAHLRHYFAIQYRPWASSTVRSLCTEVLKTANALLSEWRLPITQWPSIVNAIQCVINQPPLRRLGRSKQGKLRCALEVFIGLARSSITIRPMLIRKFRDLDFMDWARIAGLTDVVRLPDALHHTHKEMAASNSFHRTRTQEIHNSRTNVAPL